MVTNASGVTVGEDRFYPFGETRFTTGTMYTDKLFTGQREMAGLGIYHFGARFFSPKLGRFLSADTIVPNPANPQDLNRFSYVRNNPIKYLDPTGHGVDCGIGMGCVSPYRPPSGGGGGFGGVTTPVKPRDRGAGTGGYTPTPTLSPTLAPVVVATPNPESSSTTIAATATATATAPATIEPTSTLTICPTPSPGHPPCWVDESYDGPPPPYYPSLPSAQDTIDFLFEPGPVSDVSPGDIVREVANSAPMLGPYRNPAYGYGQPIGEAVDIAGHTIYMLVHYGQLPDFDFGTPPPITSTPDFRTPKPIAVPMPQTGTPFGP